MIGLTIFKSIYTIKHRNIVFCFASVLVVGLNLNVKYVCVPGWEFVISIVKQNDLIEWLHHLKFLYLRKNVKCCILSSKSTHIDFLAFLKSSLLNHWKQLCNRKKLVTTLMTQLVPNHWKKTDRNGSCKRIIHSPDPKLLLMLVEKAIQFIGSFFWITWHHWNNCNAMDTIPYVSYVKKE